MAKYVKYFASREEYNKAVLEAIEETGKEITKSKEAARAFFKRAGIVLEDSPETKAKANSKTKKSK
jgi:hypothetical protein